MARFLPPTLTDGQWATFLKTDRARTKTLLEPSMRLMLQASTLANALKPQWRGAVWYGGVASIISLAFLGLGSFEFIIEVLQTLGYVEPYPEFWVGHDGIFITYPRIMGLIAALGGAVAFFLSKYVRDRQAGPYVAARDATNLLRGAHQAFRLDDDQLRLTVAEFEVMCEQARQLVEGLVLPPAGLPENWDTADFVGPKMKNFLFFGGDDGVKPLTADDIVSAAGSKASYHATDAASEDTTQNRWRRLADLLEVTGHVLAPFLIGLSAVFRAIAGEIRKMFTARGLEESVLRNNKASMLIGLIGGGLKSALAMRPDPADPAFVSWETGVRAAIARFLVAQWTENVEWDEHHRVAAGLKPIEGLAGLFPPKRWETIINS